MDLKQSVVIECHENGMILKRIKPTLKKTKRDKNRELKININYI